MTQLCLQNTNSLGCHKAHANCKWKVFKKKGLHILHLNIESLQPKIDEIRFIAKQSNASIIGISESKLDSFILNSELDIGEYDLIRLDHIRKSPSYNHKTNFCRNTESILIDIFLPKSKPNLVGVLYQPADKSDIIEHLNNS